MKCVLRGGTWGRLLCYQFPKAWMWGLLPRGKSLLGSLPLRTPWNSASCATRAQVEDGAGLETGDTLTWSLLGQGQQKGEGGCTGLTASLLGVDAGQGQVLPQHLQQIVQVQLHAAAAGRKEGLVKEALGLLAPG